MNSLTRIFGVLLVAFSMSSIRAVHFRLSGTLECPKLWMRYSITARDHDYGYDGGVRQIMGGDQDLVIDSIYPHSYFLKFWYDDADQASEWGISRNRDYEVFFRIRHTCTDNAKFLTLDQRHGYLWFDLTLHEREQNISLHNREHVDVDADWADWWDSHG